MKYPGAMKVAFAPLPRQILRVPRERIRGAIYARLFNCIVRWDVHFWLSGCAYRKVSETVYTNRGGQFAEGERWDCLGVERGAECFIGGWRGLVLIFLCAVESDFKKWSLILLSLDIVFTKHNRAILEHYF